MAASHYPFTAAPVLYALAGAALALPADCGAAEPPGVEIGLQANALGADADLYGVGIAARYPVRDGWFVDATLERRFYDDGRGNVLAGADLQSVVAGMSLGRDYPEAAIGDWFWTWGIAAGWPDVGRQGPTGSVAEVTAIEIHLTASVGIRRRFADRWSLSGALRVERHFVDWRTTDGDGHLLRETSSLTPAGLYLALSYRF